MTIQTLLLRFATAGVIIAIACNLFSLYIIRQNDLQLQVTADLIRRCGSPADDTVFAPAECVKAWSGRRGR